MATTTVKRSQEHKDLEYSQRYTGWSYDN